MLEIEEQPYMPSGDTCTVCGFYKQPNELAVRLKPQASLVTILCIDCFVEMITEFKKWQELTDNR